MSIVFVHDHKFKKINNKIYSTGGLSSEVLSRYANIFEEVNVFSRVEEILDRDNTFTEVKIEGVVIHSANILDRKNKELEDYIKKSDGVIARLPSFLGNLAVKFAKKHKKPYLIEAVSCPWDAFWNHNFKGKIIAPYMTFTTKREIKEADYVLYVTNEFLQNRYPTTGKQIGCSDVAINNIDEVILQERKSKILNNSKKIVIGTTAAVNVKYKGQQYVIAALSKLINEGYNIEYQLVGNGSQKYLQSIAKKFNISNNIKFLGPKPHSEIFKWLQVIDIYIQPSKQEGLPRALVEALSVGCPAIGSRTGGIPELLNEEYIFNKGNTHQIYELLKEIPKHEYIKMSNENFLKAKQYENEVLSDKRNDFYNDFKNSFSG